MNMQRNTLSMNILTRYKRSVQPSVLSFLRHQTKFAFSKSRFTRYDFVANDKLTKGLRQELFLVNQTYNSLTIVV